MQEIDDAVQAEVTRLLAPVKQRIDALAAASARRAEAIAQLRPAMEAFARAYAEGRIDWSHENEVM